MDQRLRIATRESRLALWQAEHVAAQLRAAHPQLEVSLVPMTTHGDRVLDQSLAKIGGKGLFIKELEHAMANGLADLAVHSMKDVPAELPAGFAIPAILAREDPHDALVCGTECSLESLERGACVGTSSLRRQSQLLVRRPDLVIRPLRGNVDTRLGKLDGGEFDAIILAAAGLIRLGLKERIAQRLPFGLCLPAIGQGAIGVECREDDAEVRRYLAPLHDTATAARLAAERALNAALGGSCHSPIAGFARLRNNGRLHLAGFVGTPDGQRVVTAEMTGEADSGAELGHALADTMAAKGALEILASAQEQT